MKYIKNFENSQSEDKTFYSKLEKFFKEIADKKHAVVNTYYGNPYYYSVGIYLGPQDYIIKISDDLIMKRWNLNDYYPALDVYLKTKLPILDTSHYSKIDMNKILENIDSIHFSREEYEIFKNANKYNL